MKIEINFDIKQLRCLINQYEVWLNSFCFLFCFSLADEFLESQLEQVLKNSRIINVIKIYYENGPIIL